MNDPRDRIRAAIASQLAPAVDFTSPHGMAMLDNAMSEIALGLKEIGWGLLPASPTDEMVDAMYDADTMGRTGTRPEARPEEVAGLLWKSTKRPMPTDQSCEGRIHEGESMRARR